MINDIFRYDEAVPTPYVINSRDMQLLLRLFTYGLNPAKYEAEQIQYLNNANLCNDRILSLLAEKVQFMDGRNVKSDVLRPIIQNFARLVKGKGTLEKIQEAVYLYLVACKISAKTLVYINDDKDTKDYKLYIGINISPRDVSVLESILKYLVPTGWLVSIFFYEDINTKMAFRFKNTLCEITETNHGSNTMYIIKKDSGKIKGYVYPSMETVQMESFKTPTQIKEIINIDSEITFYEPIKHL